MAKKVKQIKYQPYILHMRECLSSGGKTCPACGNKNTENWEKSDEYGGFYCNEKKCSLKGESWIVEQKGKKVEVELPYFAYQEK